MDYIWQAPRIDRILGAGAVPVARVSVAFTTRPLRFSIVTWPIWQSLAAGIDGRPIAEHFTSNSGFRTSSASSTMARCPQRMAGRNAAFASHITKQSCRLGITAAYVLLAPADQSLRHGITAVRSQQGLFPHTVKGLEGTALTSILGFQELLKTDQQRDVGCMRSILIRCA
jgi:hypothetical protein